MNVKQKPRGLQFGGPILDWRWIAPLLGFATSLVAAPPAGINVQALPAFQHLADRTEPAMAWDADNLAEHTAWQKQFHHKLVDLLGRMPERVPVEVKWVDKKEFPTLTRHKIYIRTEANYWSPVYYFIPKTATEKTPAIVCLHGHSGIYPYIREGDEAQLKKSKEGSLDYAVHMAEKGYITAAIVVRGWNETADGRDPGRGNILTCRRVTMDTFLMGMTPMGLRCWDAMRVIDFLQSQPQVDPDRIGVGGLSGGGTLSLYLPVLDDRVKLVIIAGAFSSYRTSIYSIEHCICNCLPEVMLYGDMSDVVASYAPRPVLLINGIKDSIFPIAEAREGYEKLKKVYALYGASGNLDADFFDGPHSWSNNKTLPFLKRHFGP